MKRFLWPALACGIALLSFVWQDLYHETLELSSYDLRQEWTQRPARTEVLMGSIDEASKELLGPWPWPREAHALLLTELFNQKAEMVFLDLLLEEDRPGDAELGHALGMGATVIGARLDHITAEGSSRLALVPPAKALRGSTEVGLLHRLDDDGSRARHGLVLAALHSPESGTSLYPSAGAVMFLHQLGATVGDMEFSVDGLPLASALSNIGNIPDGEHPARLWVKGRVIPLTANVSQADRVIMFTALVRFRAPQTGPVGSGRDVVPYVKLPETPVAGRYVVVGENSRTDEDMVSTPLGRMKGMEVHSQTFQSLADGNVLRQLSSPKLVCVAWALLTALVMSFTITVRRTLPALLLLGLGYSGLNVALFWYGWWLPLTTPLLQLALATALLMMIRLALARSAFAEFASPEAAAQMLISNSGEELEAEAVDAVVVVTDIRGYTTLSETRTAEGMLDLLNEYHTATVAVYHRYGGRALTYQGDAQLVVFGYPKKQKDPGSAAVRACMELENVCHALRKKWGVADDVFSVGAAVCYGPVVVGRLGAAESQIQYTVIGEVVRKAHKVQSMSDKLSSATLVDEETVATMGSTELLESLGLVEVEGLAEPVTLYKPRRLA